MYPFITMLYRLTELSGFSVSSVSKLWEVENCTK